MATTATRARTTERRGFTLIEMSLVMCVAGLIMAIGVPKAIAIRRQMEADTAAHRLAQELKAAQHEAVRRNEPMVVTRIGNDAYTVGTATTVSRRIELPDGIQFVGSPSSVTFNAFGPIGGGATQTFEVKYENVRVQVAVNPAGMVSVSRPTTEVTPEPDVLITPVIDPVVTPVVSPVLY